jgi:cyclase
MNHAMTANKIGQLVLAGALFILLSAGPARAEGMKTVRVLENIYTIVHGDGIDSNTTFIVTGEGVVVIDTRVNPAEAAKVKEIIREHTDLPVIAVINTHYHGDHTFGNQVFRDSHTIIAHENVQKALRGSAGQDHLDRVKSFGITGLDEVTVTPPNVIYRDRMELFLGGYHLMLLHPKGGHTDGDTIVYLNELRLIIAGDLVSSKKIPYMGDAYLDEWINALQYIEDLDNEIIIPGHGDVGGKPIAIAMKHYLMNLRTLVKDQLHLGKNLKETQDAVRPVLKEKYKDWANLKRLDGNIERAFLEYSLKEKI